ncbi:DUF1573 domain-containing protein [Desertivirga xinjiangensis]|uniref:DUF1573 domain-containing protein n=1 Tax=Desertivirga xinjiangensis TaxID=539206 RepID=UPI00210B8F55|nr:DUF1573 domain-containing protein [Pedobacter xinjiangensis]
MKAVIILFTMLFPIIGIGQSKQDITKSKIYYGKIKLLTPEVKFPDFKAGQSYVGLILFTNISNRKMQIKEIVKDCGCVSTKISSKTVVPQKNFPIEVHIDDAKRGKLNTKIFIYFVGEEYPIVVNIKGEFI